MNQLPQVKRNVHWFGHKPDQREVIVEIASFVQQGRVYWKVACWAAPSHSYGVNERGFPAEELIKNNGRLLLAAIRRECPSIHSLDELRWKRCSKDSFIFLEVTR